MRSTQALSITLPVEMARMVSEKVASGEYASESEVVSEGLRALADRDATMERWLREEVTPAYDELKAHPERTVSLDEAFDHLEERIKSIAARK
jgi:antitoxin ParD1/3/4